MTYKVSEEMRMPKSGTEYRTLLRDGKPVCDILMHAQTPYPRNNEMTSSEWNELRRTERDAGFNQLLNDLNRP